MGNPKRHSGGEIGPAAGVDAQIAAIARRLRQLRFERGLRLVDLASMSGLSEVHLYRIEQGERQPSLRSLLQIADSYGISAAELLASDQSTDRFAAHDATAQWLGSEAHGTGTMASDGVIVTFDRSSRLRLADDTEPPAAHGTSSPERLIGMAFAGCFSMSLAEQLERDGYAPERIETLAKVAVGVTHTRVSITEISLLCEAYVPGITDDRFQSVAQWTKERCVVARALAAVPTKLDARIVDLTGGAAPRRARTR